MASLWFTWTFDARTAGMGAFQHDRQGANAMSSTPPVPSDGTASGPATPREDPVTADTDPATPAGMDSHMAREAAAVTGHAVTGRRDADHTVAYPVTEDPDRPGARRDRKGITREPAQRPLLTSSDDDNDDDNDVILKEAVTFLGLLRHNEDALADRTRRLMKRDRRLARHVLCREVGGWTPLHAATLKGARKLVKLALKCGACPDLPMGNPEEGVAGLCTPLHLAAYRGDVSLLQLLLQAGATVSPQDSAGRTPLFYAAGNGNTLAARKLIKYGADLSDLSAHHRQLYREDIERRPRLCVPVTSV